MVAFALKTPPQHGLWKDYLDVWLAADEMPIFESAWTMDHLYPLTPPLDGTLLESWTMLAALAGSTKRLRLGCMVNGMHFRHPALTAKMAVTLDHISGGRFELGLGAGWFEPEVEAYGLDLGTLKERLDRFDEGIQVIVSLLENEYTDFSGEYYTLRNARCEPKSLQQPRPPIVVGGKGKTRTLRTVARLADQWDMIPDSPADWREHNEVLREHCDAIGRDASEITTSIHIRWATEGDPVEFAEAAIPYAEAGVDMVIYSMRPPYSPALLEPLASALQNL